MPISSVFKGRSSRRCPPSTGWTAVGDAAYQVHQNLHEGKIGVLCLAPEHGQGIEDLEFRAEVGEDRIPVFRKHDA